MFFILIISINIFTDVTTDVINYILKNIYIYIHYNMLIFNLIIYNEYMPYAV